MRTGRVLFLLFLFFFASLSFAFTASAAEIKITLDGVVLMPDVPPFIAAGRTLVPVRLIAEALGAEVSWDGQKGEVTIRKGETLVKLWIGNPQAVINGTARTFEAAPVIKEGRTFVPLRLVAEALGLEVSWEEETRTVALVTPQPLGKGVVTCQDPGSVVNFRKAPSLEAPVITTLPPGTSVEVLEKTANWYRVRLATNAMGWIYGDYVRLVKEPVRVEKVEVEKTNEAVTVRLRGSAPPDYNSPFRLTNPERLVVDLPGALLTAPTTTIPLGTDFAESLRLGQFTADTVRLVFDLKVPVSLKITAEGNTLVLTLRPSTLKGRVVVLDAGHGSQETSWGPDPGAVGPTGLREADVNLAITLEVGSILEAQGVKVIYTRKGVTTLSLQGRAEVANRAGADVFVSIHANASQNAGAQGTLTIYYAPAGTPLEKQRAARIDLAREIQSALVAKIKRPDLGIMERELAVLKYTTMPSALVEVAFISNPEEEALLANPSFRKQAAQGIAEGIVRFLLTH